MSLASMFLSALPPSLLLPLKINGMEEESLGKD